MEKSSKLTDKFITNTHKNIDSFHDFSHFQVPIILSNCEVKLQCLERGGSWGGGRVLIEEVVREKKRSC